jgi:thymidylate kinase
MIKKMPVIIRAEGNAGSGKSHYLHMIELFLKKEGVNVSTATKWPSDAALSKMSESGNIEVIILDD